MIVEQVAGYLRLQRTKAECARINGAPLTLRASLSVRRESFFLADLPPIANLHIDINIRFACVPRSVRTPWHYQKNSVFFRSHDSLLSFMNTVWSSVYIWFSFTGSPNKSWIAWSRNGPFITYREASE
jgi:hypothetical protein